MCVIALRFSTLPGGRTHEAMKACTPAKWCRKEARSAQARSNDTPWACMGRGVGRAGADASATRTTVSSPKSLSAHRGHLATAATQREIGQHKTAHCRSPTIRSPLLLPSSLLGPTARACASPAGVMPYMMPYTTRLACSRSVLVTSAGPPEPGVARTAGWDVRVRAPGRGFSQFDTS